jgi:hypothetical protein
MQPLRAAARTRFTSLHLRQEKRFLEDMMNRGQHGRQPLHRRIEVSRECRQSAPRGTGHNWESNAPASKASRSGAIQPPEWRRAAGDNPAPRERPCGFVIEPIEPGARQEFRHGPSNVASV